MWKLYYITHRGSRSLAWLEEKILMWAPHVDFIQIREKDLSVVQLYTWLKKLMHRWSFPSRLLVNDRLDLALACGAHGVHLPSQGLPIPWVKKVAPENFLVFASTHSPEEAKRSLKEGADFVTLSPFFPTPSKPGAPLLPLKVLADLPPQKVFALGGITLDHLHHLTPFAISGVAGIRLFQDHPIELVKEAILRYTFKNE